MDITSSKRTDKKQKILLLTAAITATICIALAPARAEQRPQQATQRQNACTEDMNKFCSDKEPGRPRVKCLRDNKDKLSDQCRKQIDQIDKSRALLKEKCGMDATKLCPDTKLGQGELLPCILQNIDRVSPACKQTIETMRSNSH